MIWLVQYKVLIWHLKVILKHWNQGCLLQVVVAFLIVACSPKVVGSWPSDHCFHSVCWFVCLFVCSCRVFLSRLWSDFNQTRTCYVSGPGSSCVPYNIGAGWPLKTCIFRGFGAQKTISSYSFDRIVLIFGYIVKRTNTKILSSIFLQFPSLTQIMTS